MILSKDSSFLKTINGMQTFVLNVTSFWIEEGNGINNRNEPQKYIIKSECHFFYNIQSCEYYRYQFDDDDYFDIQEEGFAGH
jgi:hypothetical protein